MTRHIPALIAAGLALAACSPFRMLDALVPEEGYGRKTDIAYGSAPRQKLDIYWPEVGSPSRPVVVFFYGGSWKRGNRGSYRFVGEAFAARGYVAVVPDYRLYPEVRFPAFVEDGARAVAWVHENIRDYGGDPDRIVLAGHSAGAHIAMLLSLDRGYLDSVDVPSHAIAGVAGLAGPYAFDPLRYRTIRPIFASTANPDDARPISFARPNAPPTLLLHGEDDTLVKPVNSELLARALRAKGVNARYAPLENIGHISIVVSLATPFQDHAPVMDRIVDFIEGPAGSRMADAAGRRIEAAQPQRAAR